MKTTPLITPYRRPRIIPDEEGARRLLEECRCCFAVQAASDAMIAVDLRGRVVFASPSALRMLDAPTEGIAGDRVDRFLAGGRLLTRELLGRIRAQGTVYGAPVELRSCSGRALPARLTASLVADRGGKSLGIFAVLEDLTEKARMREALRHYDRRLGEILSASADAIIGLDDRGRIVEWNRGATDLYGWEREEIVGRPAAALLPKGGRSSRERVFLARRLREAGVVRSHETEHVRRDGSPIPVLLTLTALRDGDDRVAGYSAVVKDLSERKRLEKALIDQERLAAVGALAASVAHEIKNPLAAIGGAIEILGEAFAERDPRHEVVQEILGQIDRLDRLVRDLLLFAHPADLHRTRTDVHLILEGAVTLLRDDPCFQGVTLVRDFETSLPVVRLDEDRMQQVFVNILLNSCQAMGGQGSVRVRTFRAGGPGGEERVAVSFTDSGPGFAPEVRSRIFEPFFTTKHRGTGLGLSIVRKIVESHGGSVTAENAPGEGARVTLSLPCDPGERA